MPTVEWTEVTTTSKRVKIEPEALAATVGDIFGRKIKPKQIVTTAYGFEAKQDDALIAALRDRAEDLDQDTEIEDLEIDISDIE